MVKVTLYTTALCGYCHRAKRLLGAKGVAFDEIDITGRPDRRAAMIEKTGGSTTVPQIWVGERHIGGCDDLFALEHSGTLDALLAT